MRRRDAVAGKAQDGGVDGPAGAVVRVGGDARDVEVSGVEEAGGVVSHGGFRGVGPGSGSGRGVGCGVDEEVAAQGTAARKSACHAGVEDGRALILLRACGACGAARGERADDRRGGGAGRVGRRGVRRAEGVGRGPKGAAESGASPGAAGSGEESRGKLRVEQPGRVSGGDLSGNLGSGDGSGEIGGGTAGAPGAAGDVDAGSGRQVPVLRTRGVNRDRSAFAGCKLRPCGGE